MYKINGIAWKGTALYNSKAFKFILWFRVPLITISKRRLLGNSFIYTKAKIYRIELETTSKETEPVYRYTQIKY